MKRIVCGVICVLILSLFSVEFTFAQTAKKQLEAIEEEIPASWWDGRWDKLSELHFFISSYSNKPLLCAEAQYYIGCYYFSIGDYQLAIDAYQKVVATYPTIRLECSKAQFEIAQIYLHRLRDIPQAIAAYRKLITDYPESFLAASAQACLGKCYRYQEDYTTALLEYQKVLDNYPEAQSQHVEALLEIGDMYIHEGLSLTSKKDKKAKISEAISTYKKAYFICPLGEANLMQCVINRIHNTFKKLDMSMVRANQFIKYQKYGPAGEDGTSGTPDDPINPLAEF